MEISMILYLCKQRFEAQVLAEAETKRKNAKEAAKSSNLPKLLLCNKDAK